MSMQTLPDLRQAERRAFRTAYDDGLWDLMVAPVVATWAIAPLLSETLGDFWSSAVFVPIWLVGYLAFRLVRDRVVVPRVGSIRVGEERRRRLRSGSLVLLAINVVALGGGLGFWLVGPAGGWMPTIVLALTWLLVCSVMAFYLDTPRLYLYGLMLAAAPFLGEWLWREGYAAHHGFPVAFGLAAIAIAGVGVARFVGLLARTRRPAGDDR